MIDSLEMAIDLNRTGSAALCVGSVALTFSEGQCKSLQLKLLLYCVVKYQPLCNERTR